MDLLGSIMKKMEKPPPIDEKEKKIRQQQQQMIKKAREEREHKVKRFKETMKGRLDEFVNNDAYTKLELEPMDKVCRSIVYEIVELLDLVAFSVGREEVDRHLMVFKKETAPCDAEIAAIKRGEVYNPNAVTLQNSDDGNSLCKPRRKRKAVPEQYLQKYEKHLGGLEVAKDAARSTVDHTRTYGFVSSEQKRDKRTIEETLADIKAKKKKKTGAQGQDTQESGS